MSVTVKTEKKPTNASISDMDWGGGKNKKRISLKMSGFGSW